MMYGAENIKIERKHLEDSNKYNLDLTIMHTHVQHKLLLIYIK